MHEVMYVIFCQEPGGGDWLHVLLVSIGSLKLMFLLYLFFFNLSLTFSEFFSGREVDVWPGCKVAARHLVANHCPSNYLLCFRCKAPSA